MMKSRVKANNSKRDSDFSLVMQRAAGVPLPEKTPPLFSFWMYLNRLKKEVSKLSGSNGLDDLAPIVSLYTLLDRGDFFKDSLEKWFCRQLKPVLLEALLGRHLEDRGEQKKVELYRWARFEKILSATTRLISVQSLLDKQNALPRFNEVKRERSARVESTLFATYHFLYILANYTKPGFSWKCRRALIEFSQFLDSARATDADRVKVYLLQLNLSDELMKPYCEVENTIEHIEELVRTTLEEISRLLREESNGTRDSLALSSDGEDGEIFRSLARDKRDTEALGDAWDSSSTVVPKLFGSGGSGGLYKSRSVSSLSTTQDLSWSGGDSARSGVGWQGLDP
jgi:hypothetical protein